jgi:CHAT domain-containing protein/tetratricopeptide (TPR) repeat protein
MRSFVVSCLLFFSLQVSAQQSFPLIQQVMDLFDKKDYKNVIPVAKQAVETTKTEFGENSPFHSGMVLFLAIGHWSLFEFTEAEKWFVKHAELISRYSGENNLDYIASLNRLAQLHREMGKYQQAEASYNKALSISKTLFGVNDSSYAKSLNNLASLYHHTGQYAKSEQLYVQSRDLVKRLVGENSAWYATSLNNLATLYNDLGQYEKSKPLAMKVAELRKNILGENNEDYAQSLNNLGAVLTALGQYKEAELNYIKAKELYKKTLGDNHPDYASTLDNLAQLYGTTGEYEKAEQLLTESREIRKRTVGENHPDYASSLNNLGKFYESAGQYELSEKYFLESKERTVKAMGENHPSYVTALNNLAGLYHARGQYAKAEPLYTAAKEIRKKLVGELHPGYALSLNNMATLYQEIGQYDKALPLYLQALDIWKKTVGDTHPDYAMGLNNLAALYEDQFQYQKAEPLYTQAKDIRKAVFGVDHIDYATSLNNLAGLYAQTGQFAKAEALVIQANNTWKKVLGDNHPTIALGMNNLAAIYRKGQMKYGEAEQLYLQAIERRKKLLGDDHPLTADTENDLALLYMNMKQYKKAEPLFLVSSRIVTQNLMTTFPVLSEKEKGNYINENLFFNECNNSFLYNNPAASTAIINNNIDLQLFFKSLSLADTRNMLDAVRNSKDSSLQRLIGNWQTAKTVLAAQYALPAAKRMKNLQQKEEESEDLEKELSRRSAEFRQQQVALRVTSKDVRQQLEDDEAAIEFVSFKYYNKKKTDSIIYAAYIMKKQDSAAIFVPLFEEKQLQELITQAGRSATGVAKTFYGVAMNFSSDIADNLYVLLWKPLEKHLVGIKKISYSPAGKLYGIAFHALPSAPGKILQDKYELRQYVSTRQIAFRSSSTNATPSDIVLFGNADFSMDSAAIAKQILTGQPDNSMASVLRGGGGGWPDLPFTGAEVDTIQHLFARNKIKCAAYQKANANETNLKYLNERSPTVLHIATHGFYVPEALSQPGNWRPSDINSYKVANDPLMRNGLIMAGGNYVWAGKAPVKGAEDGVVTAYEIAQMNLAQTKLVVLSACETALGDIKGSEGVFGLQRAFKMAGVDKMIVSLWQVPDMETSELMMGFYSYWLAGKNIKDAFYSAQSDLRKKYPPFNWAAFVLIE